jgi:hypothetical protein
MTLTTGRTTELTSDWRLYPGASDHPAVIQTAINEGSVQMRESSGVPEEYFASQWRRYMGTRIVLDRPLARADSNPRLDQRSG